MLNGVKQVPYAALCPQMMIAGYPLPKKIY